MTSFVWVCVAYWLGVCVGVCSLWALVCVGVVVLPRCWVGYGLIDWFVGVCLATAFPLVYCW